MSSNYVRIKEQTYKYRIKKSTNVTTYLHLLIFSVSIWFYNRTRFYLIIYIILSSKVTYPVFIVYYYL